MPDVILIEPNPPFACEKMEGRDPQIADAGYRPDIRRPGLAVECGTLRTTGVVVADGRDFQATIAGPGEGFRRRGEPCAG